MPITQFLDAHKFDAETKRAMGLAYERARAALRLADQSDLMDEVIAKLLIDVAKPGEANPDQLCEQVLVYFRQHL